MNLLSLLGNNALNFNQMKTPEHLLLVSKWVKSQKTEKTVPPTNPATVPPQKFFCCDTTFYLCRRNARKNITVTVSVRVSVTVRVSLV